jgi:DNA-binding NtrC family response regulator
MRLEMYDWPGNIRELRNVVERAMLMSTSDEVDFRAVEAALPSAKAATASADAQSGTGPLAARVEEFERQAVLAELKRHQFHITNTARALGLERSHLYKKCQQLGIDLRAVKGGAV